MVAVSQSNKENGLSVGAGRLNCFYSNDKTLPTKMTFVAAAGATNVCEVSCTLKDGNGITDITGMPFKIWLSDSASGFGLTATTASGAVAAKASNGVDFGTLTAKKALISQPPVSGTYILSITDTAKTGFYVCVQNPFSGIVHVSSQLITANYG